MVLKLPIWSREHNSITRMQTIIPVAPLYYSDTWQKQSQKRSCHYTAFLSFSSKLLNISVSVSILMLPIHITSKPPISSMGTMWIMPVGLWYPNSFMQFLLFLKMWILPAFNLHYRAFTCFVIPPQVKPASDEFLYLLFSDKEVNTFLSMHPLKDMDETKDFYEKKRKDKKYCFAICLKVAIVIPGGGS